MELNDWSLLGKWSSESGNDDVTTLEFTEDGQLVYTICGAEKDQKIFLTYRVENNSLVTDQPSHPREERTPFSFTEDGKLALIYEGQRELYIRS
jgi:hypothetical protein